MFEAMVKSATTATLAKKLNADLDLKFTAIFAKMLEDKLAPLTAISQFSIREIANTIYVQFAKPIPGSTISPSISITVEHHREGGAFIDIVVYHGPLTVRHPSNNYELTRANADEVLDRVLSSRKSELEKMIERWVG